jgi:hypothetical protein
MRRYLAPILVLTLAAEAAGSGGAAFFCRMRRERLTTCCCPGDATRSREAVLASSACCDVLTGSAPASSVRIPTRLFAVAPERIVLSRDVDLPEATVVLAPDEVATHRGTTSGPLRRSPVFLSLRQLLI